MAKPSSPRRAVRNAPQSKAHDYIVALFEDDFGRLSKLTIKAAHGFAKKKLDTASQTLQLISEGMARKAFRASDHAFRQADRAVQAEMREADHSRRRLFRRLKTAIRPEKQIRHKPPKQRRRLWPYAAVALPKYDGPVLDRRGERGVFMRVRYYSRRTAGQGVSQRVVLYVFHGAEVDANGISYAVSNVGLTIDETLCAFDHLEQVNWAAAKNAKLLMHGIFAVDHRQTPQEMMACGTRWAEEALGRFGLPYLVTLHAPPEDGDQRNWHLHVLWSFRPMERIGDHEWLVGEMLRTDLDNPEAMKLMRQMFAAVMTDESFEAGQNQVWTAKSNAARGLVDEPQVHVGAALTNRAREGEFVAIVEENHERVHRSKVARLDETLRHADALLANRQQVEHAIARRWARLPHLPRQVPGVVAEPATIERLQEVAPPVAPSVLPTATIVTIPAVRTQAAQPDRPVTPIATPSSGLPAGAGQELAPGRAPPPRAPARPGPIKIANSRFFPAKRSAVEIPVLNLPSARADASTLVSPLPSPVSVPMRRAGSPVASAPVVPQAAEAMTELFIRPVAPPSAPAAVASLDQALDRAAEALRRIEAERDDERTKTRLAERSAAGEEQSRARAALRRLLEALHRERHLIDGEPGRRTIAETLLDRFGLDSAALIDRDVQRELDDLVHRQNSEISRIATHVRASPGDLRKVDGRWALGGVASPDIRALVELWRDDARVQVALGRYAAAAPAAPGAADVEGAQHVGPGKAWRIARELRERAMSVGDDAERLDESSASRPGFLLQRPSADHGSSAPSIPARRPPPRTAAWGLGD